MISLDNLKTTINAIKCLLTDYPKKKDIPTKLPNPNSLTFTGTVTGSYDGSEALAVEIPRVPKPLTYDYMPEGYPKKTLGTATLMEEQELAFADGGGTYVANLPDGFKVTAGQTYTVNWDGTAYECVGFAIDDTLSALGNVSITGESNNTGEPFLYMIAAASGAIGQFFTLETSASHTVSVTTVMEVIIPMSEDFLPTAAKNTTVFYV